MPQTSRITLALRYKKSALMKVLLSIGAAQFMKARAFSAMIFMLLGLAPALAVVRIGDDSGGQIGPYLAKYRALRASGERVEIDGVCASACTMLLGIIPRNH